jgi:hypothetical protein
VDRAEGTKLVSGDANSMHNRYDSLMGGMTMLKVGLQAYLKEGEISYQ